MEIPDLRMAVRAGSPCNNPGPMPALTRPRDSRRARTLTALTASLRVLAAARVSATPSTAPPTTAPSASASTAPPSTAPTAAPPSTAPSPDASGDLGGVYQTIQDQVVRIRELQPKRPISPTILDGPGLQKLI